MLPAGPIQYLYICSSSWTKPTISKKFCLALIWNSMSETRLTISPVLILPSARAFNPLQSLSLSMSLLAVTTYVIQWLRLWRCIPHIVCAPAFWVRNVLTLLRVFPTLRVHQRGIRPPWNCHKFMYPASCKCACVNVQVSLFIHPWTCKKTSTGQHYSGLNMQHHHYKEILSVTARWKSIKPRVMPPRQDNNL